CSCPPRAWPGPALPTAAAPPVRAGRAPRRRAPERRRATPTAWACSSTTTRWSRSVRRPQPVFFLWSADGAIGAHQRAVSEAYGHFEALARRLLGVVEPASSG